MVDANDHCQWQLHIVHPRKEAKYFLRVDYCESTRADVAQALWGWSLVHSALPRYSSSCNIWKTLVSVSCKIPQTWFCFCLVLTLLKGAKSYQNLMNTFLPIRLLPPVNRGAEVQCSRQFNKKSEILLSAICTSSSGSSSSDQIENKISSAASSTRNHSMREVRRDLT